MDTFKVVAALGGTCGLAFADLSEVAEKKREGRGRKIIKGRFFLTALLTFNSVKRAPGAVRRSMHFEAVALSRYLIA